MKIIFQQYGKMILASAIGICILGMLFMLQSDGNTGFLNVVSAKAEKIMRTKDASDYTDADVIKTVLSKSQPVISYSHTQAVVGVPVNLEAAFCAADADGNAVVTEITDILTHSGESVLYLSEEDRKNGVLAYKTTEFIFPTAGSYTVKVKAADRENRAAYEQYTIPVSMQ